MMCLHPTYKGLSLRDDVCTTCEKLRKENIDSVTEEDKLASTEEMHSYIVLAQKERDLYNSLIKKAKETSHLCPAERSNHFTFDFAQSVGIPHHARQMGPFYFAFLRKVDGGKEKDGGNNGGDDADDDDH